MSNESIREKAERYTKLRLKDVWDELSSEEKAKLITEAEEMFRASKQKVRNKLLDKSLYDEVSGMLTKMLHEFTDKELRKLKREINQLLEVRKTQKIAEGYKEFLREKVKEKKG